MKALALMIARVTQVDAASKKLWMGKGSETSSQTNPRCDRSQLLGDGAEALGGMSYSIPVKATFSSRM